MMENTLERIVLGFDIGTNSIGWAVILVDREGNPIKILAMGSRIIPLSPDDMKEFTTGNAISKNQKRTEKRTQRKGYDRYQQRRISLTATLKELGMLPDERLIKLPVLDLWKLRANAVKPDNQLSLQEIGRVLYHLNQKRGYKHAKADESKEDKKQKDYVANVNQRFETIKIQNKTIGQFFYDNLKASEITNEKGPFYTYRIKDQVFPRKAYEEEFDSIMNCQKIFYPNILTEQAIDKIRNEIIYYQRRLKSCKHLVSLCEFEKRAYKNKEGKIVFDGPKVAPKTSPLFQLSKMWESVNNITLQNKRGDELYISKEQRQALFYHLDNNEKLTLTDLYKILNVKKSDGWWAGKAIGKGLQGNTTKMQLKKALGNLHNAQELLKFDLTFIDTNLINETTGEIVQAVSPDVQNQNLYQLWHTVYSISEREELYSALKKKFGIESKETLDNLYVLDFVKSGFGNKSAKAIRRILPFLQEGLKYSEACESAGFKHSDSFTVAENNNRKLLDKLSPIEKNTLRQPVVEKILNQLVNIVNALIEQYSEKDENGKVLKPFKFDEVRVELSRDLKQSKEERNKTFLSNEAMSKLNEEIAKRLKEEYNIQPTKKIIEKYKYIFPIKNSINSKTDKFNSQQFQTLHTKNVCIYCGEPFSLSAALNGDNYDVDHILPRDLICDDSQSNKVLVCRKCNGVDKKNATAYDFIRRKGKVEFDQYLSRVEEWHREGIISEQKRIRLLASYEDYLDRKKENKETEQDIKLWEEFVSRQIKETQFISREALRILKTCFRTVNATSGTITARLRHLWGWDKILHDLNFERYKIAPDTIEVATWTSNHGKYEHSQEQIKGWSKRLDHRHQAIDGLLVACTKQGYIQRLNTFHAAETKDVMNQAIEQSDKVKNKKDANLLDKYLISQCPFSTADVAKEADKVLVSFKMGKRAASFGKRISYKSGKKEILQKEIIIPKGALHEESVYGQIKTIEKMKPLKYLFENPTLIFKPYIKGLVEDRLIQFEGNVNRALSSLKKDPIYLDKEKQVILEYATCYKSEYVIKYSLANFSAKDVESIVDEGVKRAVKKRLEAFVHKEKEAFKNLENNPIYVDDSHQIPIKTVRCYTGLNVATPVRRNEKGENVGFVKTGNNHHVAIYKDELGRQHEHIVTFWHAVERKKHAIPIIITHPSVAWDNLIEREDLPDSFLNNLPNHKWSYHISLQQNEMFILGMPEEEFDYAIRNGDYGLLSKYLYRVQSISESDYWFRFHIETMNDKSDAAKEIKKFYRVNSLKKFEDLNPHKVQITLLGKIKIIE